MSAKFDNLIRLALVMLVILLDIYEYPLPLPDVEKVVVQNAFKNCKNGRCPFLLYPPLEETSADGSHRISMQSMLTI